MKDKARYIACKVLIDIEERGAYSNIKINEYFMKFELTPVDKAFATEIIYGTIRWVLKIDYLIQRDIDFKIQDLDLWTLVCLRTAIYQLYFMEYTISERC